MDKGTQVEQIHRATRLLKERGVEVGFFLQFGYLGESKDDINQTIKMLLDLMPHDIGVSVSYPLPGTGFYQKVEHQLRDKKNWVDSDDLAMMYQGTFSQSYYRKLHRYVHKIFRSRQILQKLSKIDLWFQHPQVFLLAYYLLGSWIDRLTLRRLEKRPQL